jgi:DNA-binding protein HU-beta
MTKTQLLQALADQLGKSKKEVGDMLDAIVQLAYAQTKKEGEFTLPGVGKLIKKRRDARTGRNPATGATIQIPAKTVIKFRVAKQAKDAIL